MGRGQLGKGGGCMEVCGATPPEGFGVIGWEFE